MIGIIYHVVDKATQEIVKVGSTIRNLPARWRDYDKIKYPNHELREAKILESNEFDFYDKEDFHCPFLWHLVSAEHCEMINQGTFRKSLISNKQSPLDQKYFGFDAVAAASLGGKANVESGHLQRISSIAGKISGKKRTENGFLRSISSSGGLVSGKKAAENKTGIHNPNFDRAAAAKLGGPKGMHIRWHTKKSVISPSCLLCREVTV